MPDHVDYLSPELRALAREDVAIPTSDGLLLHGWRARPRGERRGVVLQFHGNAQNMSSHIGFVAWLVDEGFEVIAFDYRGYGLSPGEPSRDGLVADGISALRYVDTLPDLAGLDLFVLAQSLGGAVAVPSLAEYTPKALRGLVVESSFASYRDLAQQKLAGFWLTWPIQWPLSFLVTDGWAPDESIGRLQVPLVVIHGAKDDVVPESEGRRLFAAAGSPDRQFWQVADGGHTPAFLEYGSTFRPRLLEFFCKQARRACR